MVQALIIFLCISLIIVCIFVTAHLMSGISDDVQEINEQNEGRTNGVQGRND